MSASSAMQPSSSAQAHALPLSASSAAATGEPIQCNGCKQGLEDSLDNTVVSFGSSFFHVDCRCAKCSRHVEHNMSLLLLADGNPVCENCKYICSSCHKPIHNEAIVTGDESYHSECFRCRSCQNKIEELIFAKTNQGIWCMACHNERVARTRKHAEAKRNRQARKDRDNGSSSASASASAPRSSRSRLDRPVDGGSGDRTADLPDLPSAPAHVGDSSATATAASPPPPQPQVRPLPPSPGPVVGSSSSYGRASPLDHNGVAHQRAQAAPGDAPRHTPALPLAPSASSQSIAALSRSASPLHHHHHHYHAPPSPPVPPPSHSHTRTASQLSEEHPHAPPRRASASGLRNEFGAAAGSPSSPRRPSGDYPARPESPLPPPVPVLLGGGGDAFGPGPSLPDKQGRPPLAPVPAPAPATTSSASLAAPTTSRSERRRSGFYGAQARPSLGDEAISAQLGGGGGGGAQGIEGGEATAPPPLHEALFAPSTTPPNPPAHPHPHPHPHAPSPSHAPPTSDDLHTSVSFYDPDTLLFLNHVGGAPSSSSSAPAADKALPDPTLSLNDEAIIERLGTPSPAPSAVASGDDATDDDAPLGAIGGGGGGGAGGGNGVARRVRESIRLQKRESEGRASEGTGSSAPLSVAGLDVELVEMLLAELEATKKEMKEIKSRYNAFRRASRSAFEGFSMAREEYDKEAAARREAEHQMQILRAKFIEQARRLAQVDEEQKTAETLKRQSKDLRNSVVGMERHLSQLKAEVALSTAQVAELTALGKDEPGGAASVPDRTSSSTAHDEVAEALNARLETVKDVHRDEINALVVQRDELSRQVAELKLARDAHLEEASELAARNLHLVEKNNEAARQLDGLHESLSRLSLLSSKNAASVASSRNGGHAHSPSNASLLTTVSSVSVSTSTSGARSPLATARYISSPAEGESMHRFAKPEVVEASSRNKFWGKSKPKVAVADVSRQNQQLPPPPPPSSSSAGTKSPVVSMRSGSVDSGVRQHAFQVTSILRPVRCDYCGDKMWGLNEMRCTACGSYAHAKCSGYLSSGCHPGGSGPSAQVDDALNFVPTGPPMFGGDLEDQAHKEGVEVPTVVDKCIEAVEAFGMTYEGIYRKTGGMGQTKLITLYFERGLAFDLQDRDKFNDIAAITSCMKNYFRSLPVPLMTHDLHEDFVAAAELPEGDERLQAIERVLYQLPPAHFHTARLLFRHLNHVKSLSAENKMTSANLGVVFGPTVLRSPIPAREWSDMGPKAKLVEILCDHAEALFAKPFPPTSTA